MFLGILFVGWPYFIVGDILGFHTLAWFFEVPWLAFLLLIAISYSVGTPKEKADAKVELERQRLSREQEEARKAALLAPFESPHYELSETANQHFPASSARRYFDT